MVDGPNKRQLTMDELVFKHGGEFAVRQVGSENVLIPIRNRVGDLDSVFTLNDVAFRVWESLDGERRLDSIIEAICDEYEVTAETARADVDELIRGLEEAHLIERVEGKH
jgi:hypothetical protein